jgi:hypothetical protein
MIRPRFLPALALGGLLALAACDSQTGQRSFEAEAAQLPSGITATDDQGNVVGSPDPDDWRTSPAFPSVTVSPVYPNPVPAAFTGTVRLPVSIPFTGSLAGGLRLLAYDPRPPGRLGIVADVPPNAVFEFTELNFTLPDLRAALQLADARGLYRLYLRDGTGRLVSYGDFRVD